MNNILRSIFSNAELYTNNHRIYNLNGLYAHESHLSNNFKNTLIDYSGILHCDGFDTEEDPQNPNKADFSLEEWICTVDLTVSCCTVRSVSFFTRLDLLHPNMQVRMKLIRARPNFQMTSGNPNVDFGIVDCSLYNRRVMLKGDYHKKHWFN